ncbi:MAG: hypothetical protein ABJQ70_17070 [Roseobacter sp.]
MRRMAAKRAATAASGLAAGRRLWAVLIREPVGFTDQMLHLRRLSTVSPK